jgi:predicted acetyltransferase
VDEITIRTIDRDELPRFMTTLGLAFHGGHSPDEIEAEKIIAEPDRYFAAFEGDRMVGTAGACTTRLTVPGGVVSAPGVTAVGVLPSHRRRGINTRLARALLDQAAERGEPLAYLWASESPIYGRFGYGMASFCAEIEMTTRRSAFVGAVEPQGRIRLLEREEALPLMRPVYEATAANRPGMIAIDDRWWEWLFKPRKQDEDKPPFHAVHLDGDGSADGYVVYKVKHDWAHGVPSNTLEVEHLICATSDAEAAIWRYLFDVDLVATVKAWDRPPDESVLWLVQEPRLLRFWLSDGLWVRLLDVAHALSARRYSADGRLVLGVHDGFRPETSGRYDLRVEAGTGGSARTDDEPDLEMEVGALGAAYLGGSSFRQLARAHQVRERTRGALARADAMFAWDPAPWFGFVF